MRSILLTLAALTVGAATAAAEDLPTFLTAATAAARPNAPVRADGTLVTTSPDGSVTDQIAIIYRPNGDLYVELQKAGARALLLADGRAAVDKRALEEPLDSTEFTREDLRAFKVGDYRSPTIVDRRDGEITVSVTPEPSQYALQVITFDTDKKVPLLVKNYKDTISNLVKMRRSRKFASVAGTWLPGEIVMENFPLRSTSTMTLTWKPTEDVPGLFDPASLGKSSTLTWPQ
jgi:hypothetical protein